MGKERELKENTPLKWLSLLPILALGWGAFYLKTIIPQYAWWAAPFWITYGIAGLFSLGFYVNTMIKYKMD